MAATLKDWSNWGALGGKDRERITRKAFSLRRRIAGGRPVTEDERRLLQRYETDPTRPRKRRTLASPDPAPIDDPGVLLPSSEAAPQPEPEPVPADGSALPGLDASEPEPEAKPDPEKLKQTDAQAHAAFMMLSDANEKNRKEGKFALPELYLNMVVYPASVGIVRRHGGISLTPTQEYAVVGTAVAAVAIASFLPPKDQGPELAAPKPAAPVEKKEAPAPAGSTPDEGAGQAVDDNFM